MSTQAGAPVDDDQEYAEGYAAGLVWLLTADGRAYLDPDNTDSAGWPTDPARYRPGKAWVGPYNQAMSDAIKHVAWHAQRPTQTCADGSGCEARAWWRVVTAVPEPLQSIN
jgi:hypothetical protein